MPLIDSREEKKTAIIFRTLLITKNAYNDSTTFYDMLFSRRTSNQNLSLITTINRLKDKWP